MRGVTKFVHDLVSELADLAVNQNQASYYNDINIGKRLSSVETSPSAVDIEVSRGFGAARTGIADSADPHILA